MTDLSQTPDDITMRTETPRDEIARRAYKIYDSSGHHPGRCEQNWLQAERELREQVMTEERTEIPHESPCPIAPEDAPLRSASTRKNRGKTRVNSEHAHARRVEPGDAPSSASQDGAGRSPGLDRSSGALS